MDKPALSEAELQQLVALARKAMWQDREVKRRLQAAGINLTPANFYSTVPLVEDIERSFELAEEAAGLAPWDAGGVFRREAMLAFAERIGRHAGEFAAPEEGDRTDPEGFFWGNPAFSGCDALAYYCMLRHLKPRRVVEVGSGFSTLVADMALRANGFGEIVCIEPFPPAFLAAVPSVARIDRRPVQAIPLEEMVALVESAQVWFIDSTHTVKAGSDCLYLYLRVMPRVATDVACHSHDIFLPYALPEKWAIEKNVFWTEQYLLLAWLLDNPRTEVLFGSNWLRRSAPEAFSRFMCGRPGKGASFWYRLNATGGAG
jgi:hypothetical protein